MSETFTLGCQLGAYSPPAPCLDFRFISSAISLKPRASWSTKERNEDDDDEKD